RTDFDQGPDQSTNHAAQQAFPHYPEGQLVPALLPARREDTPERLSVGAPRERESRKIVPSWQERRRSGHLFRVGRGLDGGHEEGVERREDESAAQPVDVLLPPGVLAGVEPRRH